MKAWGGGAPAVPDAVQHTDVAAVDGGFLSVANNRVSILSEHALLSEEIDVNEARTALEAARDRSRQLAEDA